MVRQHTCPMPRLTPLRVARRQCQPQLLLTTRHPCKRCTIPKAKVCVLQCYNFAHIYWLHTPFVLLLPALFGSLALWHRTSVQSCFSLSFDTISGKQTRAQTHIYTHANTMAATLVMAGSYADALRSIETDERLLERASCRAARAMMGLSGMTNVL